MGMLCKKVYRYIFRYFGRHTILNQSHNNGTIQYLQLQFKSGAVNNRTILNETLPQISFSKFQLQQSLKLISNTLQF